MFNNSYKNVGLKISGSMHTDKRFKVAFFHITYKIIVLFESDVYF